MRLSMIALLLALAAGCDGHSKRPSEPPPGAALTQLKSDPERRYPQGTRIVCSWDRDRFLHFFSTDVAVPREVAFLDAAGRVVERVTLPAFSESGVTSKVEARHAWFLPADSKSKLGDAIDVPLVKADPMPVVKVGGHAVHVETSHLLSQRQRGLMHRPRLSKDDGMLFLYASAGERSYWMLNTLIALDIAYFDAEGRLLNVARMKPAPDPSQGGELRAPSAAPARFVLEVNYGWFDARGLIDADGKPKSAVRLEMPDAVRRLADDAE